MPLWTHYVVLPTKLQLDAATCSAYSNLRGLTKQVQEIALEIEMSERLRGQRHEASGAGTYAQGPRLTNSGFLS
jgi:hypothetical protein